LFSKCSGCSSSLGWKTLTTANARGLVTGTSDPNGDVNSIAFYADGSAQGSKKGRSLRQESLGREEAMY